MLKKEIKTEYLYEHDGCYGSNYKYIVGTIRRYYLNNREVNPDCFDETKVCPVCQDLCQQNCSRKK